MISLFCFFSFYLFIFIFFIFGRAQKRMEGEYVLGSKILVEYLGKEKGNTIGKNLGKFVDELLSLNVTYAYGTRLLSL